MADLTEVAGETLVAMTDLERRAGEVTQAVGKVIAAASLHTHELDSDEARFLARFESAATHLGGLEKSLAEAGGLLARRIADQTRAVDQQAHDLDSKQADLRRHLSDLRGAASKLSTEVKTLQDNTHKTLTHINTETATLLAATVTALNSVEETLRTATDPAVKDVSRAIQDRGQDFKKYIDTQLVPRVEKDSKEFGRRIQVLTSRLTDLLVKAHQKTAEQAKGHISRLNSVSATDWYGRSGDCQSTARVQVMQRLGQQKSDIVQAQAVSTLYMGRVFDDLMKDAIRKYQSVYNVPTEIDRVAGKV